MGGLGVTEGEGRDGREEMHGRVGVVASIDLYDLEKVLGMLGGGREGKIMGSLWTGDAWRTLR